MTIKETTPFGRIFHRWLYVLTFALIAGLVASGSAFADHSRGHKGDTGGGSGGNDNNLPVIEDQFFSLDENLDPGTLVGQVIATNPKKNNILEYQILPGGSADLFAIDLLNGDLTTTEALDHETVSAHALSVLVTDKFGRSSEGTVTVSVGDINEKPTLSGGSFAVSELTQINTVVKIIQASDPDDNSEPFGTLTYQIALPSSGPILFEIDPTTGELTTIADLDHETVPSVIVTVVVVDGDGLSDFADFTVTIEDANEAPVAADTSFDVSELIPVGAIVGTVPASDPDNSAPYNTLSYAITGGNVGSAFDIDSATGELSTLAALDFGVVPTYNLTVEVTDGGGLSNTANVTVNVNEAVIPSNVSEIDGTNGFRIPGVSELDGTGREVAILGDVNGDSIDDFAISAAGEFQNISSVYVIFGTNQAATPEFDLTSLDGTNGFRFDGVNINDFIGEAINSAGDINNDGLADILISAFLEPDEFNSPRVAVYVVFGKQQFAPVLTVADLDGVTGFQVIAAPGEFFPNSPLGLSSIGDINGDGVNDFASGATDASFDGVSPQTGKVFAIFGRDIPNSAPDFGPIIEIENLDPLTGMVLYGAPGDGVGLILNPIGDINGDTFGDFVINSASLTGNYVVFGNLNTETPQPGEPLSFDLSTLDGTNGFSINVPSGSFLYGAPGGGDINGDGRSDTIIGSPGEDINGLTDAGAAYVIFGTDSNFVWPANFDLASLDGTNGFRILGETENGNFGFPMDNRSDIDGDGFEDIVAGATVFIVPQFPDGEPLPPPPPAFYYLIAGSNLAFPPTIDLLALDPSVGGQIEVAQDTERLSAGGDVNGDGAQDFILSAGQDQPATVVFGADF